MELFFFYIGVARGTMLVYLGTSHKVIGGVYNR